LALIVAGISLVKFFNSIMISIVGWILIFLGVIALFFGARSFYQMSKVIKKESQKHKRVV